MERQQSLDLGRESFAGKAWREASDLLTEADRQLPLDAEDLEQLAAAWYLAGGDEESVEVWSRAHHEYLRRGETARAARCAFWLGFGLLLRNEPAQGGGWLARAQRLLDEGNLDCVERGYLLVPRALQHMGQGDIQAASATFMRAADVGVRFGELELIVQARLGVGQAMIKLGDIGGGLAMLDEVMVAATAGEVSVITVGVVYCATILECREIFDLRGAGEWTDAQPLVPIPTRPGPVPQRLPGASCRDHAATRPVAGRSGGGGARLPAPLRRAGGRRSLSPARRPSPVARRVRCRRGVVPPLDQVGP